MIEADPITILLIKCAGGLGALHAKANAWHRAPQFEFELRDCASCLWTFEHHDNTRSQTQIRTILAQNARSILPPLEVPRARSPFPLERNSTSAHLHLPDGVTENPNLLLLFQRCKSNRTLLLYSLLSGATEQTAQDRSAD